MLKSARRGAVAIALIGPAMLCGCSAPAPVTATNMEGPASALTPVRLAPRVFTLNTPIKRIAADPDGKAILDRDIPGVMASNKYPLFDDLSLSQIAIMSGGRLTKSKLDLVQTDLVQLSDLNP
jgi:hypothetical protein